MTARLTVIPDRIQSPDLQRPETTDVILALHTGRLQAKSVAEMMTTLEIVHGKIPEPSMCDTKTTITSTVATMPEIVTTPNDLVHILEAGVGVDRHIDTLR